MLYYRVINERYLPLAAGALRGEISQWQVARSQQTA